MAKGKTKAITIEQLHKLCDSQMKQGRGKLHILISGDDEGNSYHELFFGFTPNMDFSHPVMATALPFGVTPGEASREYIVLG